MMQLQIFNPLVFVRKYKANMISAEHLLSFCDILVNDQI